MKKLLAALGAVVLFPVLALAQFTAVSTLTLPSTTTAYSAGQLMASSATAGSVVVPSFPITAPGTFIAIPRLRLSTNDTTASSWNAQTVLIDLWSAAPTFTNGDRGAFAVATGAASHLGQYTCTMSAIAGDGAYAECSPVVGQYTAFQSPVTSRIYWTLTASSGSGTTGASKVWSLYPEVVY